MRQRTVLLIASHCCDGQRTRRTFEQISRHHILRIVSDGTEALAYLRQEGIYSDPRQAPHPDIIMLDLPLPRLSGLELLQCIKQDSRLRHVPVIVLATSLCPDEVSQVYVAGANSYVQKPMAYSCFTEVVGALEKFWLETAQLPSDV